MTPSPSRQKRSEKKRFRRPVRGVQKRWKEGIKMFKIFKGGHDGCGKILFAVVFVLMFSGLATWRAAALSGL